jgi:predicted nucleotidyltransferase
MSSREPLAAPAELLAAFGEAARKNRWRWYVFGAQAVVAYGRPRMTADVDVALDADGKSNVDVVGVLRDSGFGTRFEWDAGFLEEARLLPMVHVATAMPVDVVVVQPGLQEEFLERSRSVDVGGVQVPMISPEDLIASKILAARRKDLEDVRGVLLERWESLDFEQMRAVVARLDEALETRKLGKRLQRLMRQVKALLERP